MKNTILNIFWIAILLSTLTQCHQQTITSTVKTHPNDPFKNTIVASQAFEIDSRQDTIIEGKKGTRIVLPKGCFKNAKGEVCEGLVKIEIAEALSLEDMLLSNLTTSADGKPLETDGMIYINASSEGSQLSIRTDKPIYIEIPTLDKKPKMKAYQGIRDENGNMNWIEPIDIDHELLTVDIRTLDFLPPGFQAEVDKGMPFQNYKIATQTLTDSLYYLLAVTDGSSLLQGLLPTQYNEPYQNKTNQKEDTSIQSNMIITNPKSNCGIDPAMIKVLKSEKYQNTFIATREFEARLQVIFKTCNNAVLETYIQNLDKNLYIVDSLAAIAASDNEYQKEFIKFSQQRLTKVKDADKYASLLKGYYEKQYIKIKLELEKGQEKYLQKLRTKNEAFQKVADEYKELLVQREKYRMESYGFQWTKTGWVNIDNGDLPKTWGPKTTEGIYVTNGKSYDRVYTYLIFTSLKSLYSLITVDNIEFYAGNATNREMLMPNEGKAILISIGYIGESPSLAIKEFELDAPIKYNLTLEPSTMEKIKEAISYYEKDLRENKILNDLEFKAKFYEEEQRQKETKKESDFLLRLWHIAFPCCADQADSTITYKKFND